MTGCGPHARRTLLLLSSLLLALFQLPSPAAWAVPEEGQELFDLGHLVPGDPSLFDLGHDHTDEIEIPWNAGIHATTFAISGIHFSGLGHKLDTKAGYFVALPSVRDELPCLNGRMMRKDKATGTITCRVIEIRPHGKAGPVIEATVEDIGPWNIADPYWIEGERPDAEDGTTEKGRDTNRAGIDVSAPLMKALGLPRSAKVDWRFKTDENGDVVTVTRTESFRA